MKFKLVENISPLKQEKERIKDVIDIIKDIKYGFISKIDGSIIDDREWIHANNSDKYYSVNSDPEVTIKNKLGICQDQALVIEYLMNKYHPEDKVYLYELIKSPKGHCVACYEHGGKWYYLESAWDKERGLHGPFDSQEELEKYLEELYYKHHKDDTPEESEVIVRKYRRR